MLFGDGAAGVLLSDTGAYPLIEKEVLAADGTRGDSLTSGYRALENPYYQEDSGQTSALTMDGREIFDFVIRDVEKSLQAMLGDEAQDIDYFLLHQANARILEKVARKLKLPQERFLQNMNHYGNTSAATVPLLLDEAVQAGQLRLGSRQKLVLSGFGGGLTWGHLVIRL